jgi:A/G-specific adenine glycosylase
MPFIILPMMNFSETIIGWYQSHARDLPWRKTNDPYKIWVSEIILQQTRVDQGIHYYQRFIKRFPDIYTLAGATEEEVLKLWQGLGYYSRARNLHRAARMVQTSFAGEFPCEFDELLKLPGIGKYTASAIASLAFNKPVAVVDGNVYRVISRLFGIYDPKDSVPGEKIVLRKAGELMENNNPGIFNQAMMEFGAIQCTPRNPSCERCIFLDKCYAYKHNMISELPARIKKAVRRNRYLIYLVITSRKSDEFYIYLRKRTGNDIWKNLYDFPVIEQAEKITALQIASKIKETGIADEGGQILVRKKIHRHVLTHQIIFARFAEIRVNNSKISRYNFPDAGNWSLVPVKKLAEYPVPRLIEIFLKENRFFSNNKTDK